MSSVLEPSSHIRTMQYFLHHSTPAMFHPHGMHDLLVEDLLTPNTPYTSRTYLVSRGHKLVITCLLFSPPWFSGHRPKLYLTYRTYLFHSVSVRSTDDALILHM